LLAVADTTTTTTTTHLLHHGQNPRLSVVVSVSSNAQVDLLRGAVLAVCGHQAEQRILGRERHDILREGRRHSVGAHRRRRELSVELVEALLRRG
jgi:hypothetical protein